MVRLYVMLAVVLVGTSVMARAEPSLLPGIKDWQLTDTGIRLVVDIDQMRDGVRQAALSYVSANVPLHDFEWFNFRFSALTVQVDAVDVRAARAPNEAVIELRGGIEARRARRRYAVFGPWDANGGKRIARVSTAGRLRIDASKTDVTLTLLGDSFSVQSELNPINGLTVTKPLNGRTLHARSFVLTSTLPAEMLERVRIVAARITHINKSTMTVDLDVEAL